MEKTTNFLLTISRQLGSGGAHIGQELAKRLDLFYADREIINQAAKQLSVVEEDLESREEKKVSFWQSFLQSYTFNTLDTYIPPEIIIPTDLEVFNAEKAVIERIAKEKSAVIIGRCGSYILRDHPNHLKVFFHSDIDFRKDRVQRGYNITEKEAEKMIVNNDVERSRYFHTYTGEVWTDTRQYDLSINTSKIGLDKSVELIAKYLESK